MIRCRRGALLSSVGEAADRSPLAEASWLPVKRYGFRRLLWMSPDALWLGPRSAIRSADWHLIVTGDGEEELFNLAEDLLESRNLVRDPSLRRTRDSLFTLLQAALGEPAAGPVPRRGGPEAVHGGRTH